MLGLTNKCWPEPDINFNHFRKSVIIFQSLIDKMEPPWLLHTFHSVALWDWKEKREHSQVKFLQNILFRRWVLLKQLIPNFKKSFLVFLLRNWYARWGNHSLLLQQLWKKDLSFKSPKVITSTCAKGPERKEVLFENLRHYELTL